MLRSYSLRIRRASARPISASMYLGSALRALSKSSIAPLASPASIRRLPAAYSSAAASGTPVDLDSATGGFSIFSTAAAGELSAGFGLLSGVVGAGAGGGVTGAVEAETAGAATGCLRKIRVPATPIPTKT